VQAKGGQHLGWGNIIGVHKYPPTGGLLKGLVLTVKKRNARMGVRNPGSQQDGGKGGHSNAKKDGRCQGGVVRRDQYNKGGVAHGTAQKGEPCSKGGGGQLMGETKEGRSISIRTL